MNADENVYRYSEGTGGGLRVLLSPGEASSHQVPQQLAVLRWRAHRLHSNLHVKHHRSAPHSVAHKRTHSTAHAKHSRSNHSHTCGVLCKPCSFACASCRCRRCQRPGATTRLANETPHLEAYQVGIAQLIARSHGAAAAAGVPTTGKSHTRSTKPSAPTHPAQHTAVLQSNSSTSPPCDDKLSSDVLPPPVVAAAVARRTAFRDLGGVNTMKSGLDRSASHDLQSNIMLCAAQHSGYERDKQDSLGLGSRCGVERLQSIRGHGRNHSQDKADGTLNIYLQCMDSVCVQWPGSDLKCSHQLARKGLQPKHAAAGGGNLS